MKHLLIQILVLGLSLSAAAPAKSVVRVLTYSSMLEKNGLGERIKEIAQSKGLEIEFNSSKDFAGILGSLRRLKREHRLEQLDLVLGINESNYLLAKDELLIEEGSPFEESSFGFLVNTKILPKSVWPKSWADVPKLLKGKVLVQDPRTSEPGLAWLMNSIKLGNLSPDEAKALPLKTFPKWSVSFDAFKNGLAPVIWTYSTSAAYFACENDPLSGFLENIPLPRYPRDRNFLAVVKKNLANVPNRIERGALINLLLSDEIQGLLWTKNWTLPASPRSSKSLKAPECYSKIWLPADAVDLGVLSPKELLKHLDQWSL